MLVNGISQKHKSTYSTGEDAETGWAGARKRAGRTQRKTGGRCSVGTMKQQQRKGLDLKSVVEVLNGLQNCSVTHVLMGVTNAISD